MIMMRLMLTSCAAYARKKRKYGHLIKMRLFRNSCKNYAHPKLHRTLSLSMQPLNVHYYALLSHYYLFCASIFIPISTILYYRIYSDQFANFYFMPTCQPTILLLLYLSRSKNFTFPVKPLLSSI